jgi:Flp pilus assembly protein TadG
MRMPGVATRAARAPSCLARPRGQALVETAVVLPIFLLLLMGLFDLGRVVYAQHTLTQDSREATRKGQVTPAYSQAQYDAIRLSARNMSPGTTLANANITGDATRGCAAAALAVGITTADDTTNAASCMYPDGISIGSRVVVNITVTVPLITPIISQLVGGSITVTTASVSYVQ